MYYNFINLCFVCIIFKDKHVIALLKKVTCSDLELTQNLIAVWYFDQSLLV